ncbi:MAG: hypothetical protein ACP5KX_02300 [Caldisericia bacterium]
MERLKSIHMLLEKEKEKIENFYGLNLYMKMDFIILMESYQKEKSI